MANTRIQLKRTTTAALAPNTTQLAVGELGINVTDRKLYSYDGTVIFEIGTGGAYYKGNSGTIGSAADKGNLFRLNSNTLSTSITILDGENALTCGPVTVANGFTLTINSGGRAVIV